MAACFCGVALLVFISAYYRIDLIRCAEWPSRPVGLFHAALYLIALALLSAGWLALSFSGDTKHELRSAVPTIAAGCALHVFALFAMPFLSDDGLAYAAIGRAMAEYGASAYEPLGQSLPRHDTFLRYVAEYPSWTSAGSAYSIGFNLLAQVVSHAAGASMFMTLKLHQAIAMAATLATAALAALAAARPGDQAGVVTPSRAAAFILFSPLTLIEATINAHNDALLMLVCAVALVAFANGRGLTAMIALLAGIAIKLSGLLLPVLLALHYMFGLMRRLTGRQGVVFLSLCAFALMVIGVFLLLPWFGRYAYSVVTTLGLANADALPLCTRSLECLPRVAFWALGWPTLALGVAILFRLGGLALLVSLAALPFRLNAFGTLAGTFLLFYYLYFHSYAQAWYLLSMLPFVPFLHEKLRPAALALIVCALAQYALDLPLNTHCDRTPLTAVLAEIAKALVVICPSTFILWGQFREGGWRGFTQHLLLTK